MNKYHSNKCILKARLTFTSCVESVVYDLFLLLALLAFLKMSRTFILYLLNYERNEIYAKYFQRS